MLTETEDAAAPSAFGHVLLRPRPIVLYIAVTLCFTTGGFVLGIYGQGGLSLIPFWIGVALTGPLGVVAAIFAGVPLGSVVAEASAVGPLASPPNILDGSVFPGLLVLFFTTALVVVVNVLLVRRWVYATRASIDKGDSQPVRRAIERVVGSCLFVYSGAGFVLLCLVAAYGSIVGTASDLVSPRAASTGHTVILVSFLIGFASATAGLVLWIVFTRTRRPILIPAAIDLVIVAGAFVAAVVSVLT
jgi:uncharacterized membrane protein YhaH (DUF805 family)